MCHYLTWHIFLLVVMMQLEMEEGDKKNSTYSAPTSAFLIFVECFYCSGRTNSGNCSLALGEF